MVRVTGSRPDQRSPAGGRRAELAWLVLWLTCAAILLVIPGWPAILADLGVIGLATAACRLAHGNRMRRDATAVAREIELLRALCAQMMVVRGADTTNAEEGR